MASVALSITLDYKTYQKIKEIADKKFGGKMSQAINKIMEDSITKDMIKSIGSKSI